VTMATQVRELSERLLVGLFGDSVVALEPLRRVPGSSGGSRSYSADPH
jgi:hypothetical protein